MNTKAAPTAVNSVIDSSSSMAMHRIGNRRVPASVSSRTAHHHSCLNLTVPITTKSCTLISPLALPYRSCGDETRSKPTMDRSQLRKLVGVDSDTVLNVLTRRQHVAPHTPL